MKHYDTYNQADNLVDRATEDQLDEGYTPMDRQPASHRTGVTGDEQRRGDTWDERLVQEEPEPDPYAAATADDPSAAFGGAVEEDARAGRLVAPDEGAHEDEEKDVVATDVGVDGGAASAEEAAMHVVDMENPTY